MSTKIQVQVVITDDLDGTEAAETIMLGWKGTWYEVDLNKDHADELTEFIEPFIKAGRRADAPRVSITGAPVHPGRGMEARRFNAAARQWGRENGWPEERLKPGVALPKQLRTDYTNYLVKQSRNVA
jgi:hypothetical protein